MGEWSGKFEEWGVATERLIKFSVPPAPGIKHRRFGKSLYVLESDLLDKIRVCCGDRLRFVCLPGCEN